MITSTKKGVPAAEKNANLSKNEMKDSQYKNDKNNNNNLNVINFFIIYINTLQMK